MTQEPTYEELKKKVRALERAEKDWKTLRAKLADAIAIAHLGPWEYDIESDLFTFNDHFYKMLRTTADQVGGYTMPSAEYARRFVHPDDLHVVAEEIRKAIETSDPTYNRQLEHRILFSDGAIGHITVRFSIVKDAHGQTAKLYGVNQDITERKEMEMALREGEDHLRSLIRAIPDLVWLKDPKGVYLSCNSRFESFFGAKEKEIIGKTDYDFVDKDLADFFRRHDNAAIKKGEASSNEEDVVFAADGHCETLDTIKTPLYGSSGRLTGVLGIGRDITARKRAETALQQRIEFEQLVSRISSKLAGTIGSSIDPALEQALENVGTFTGADRAYVFQFKADMVRMDNTHEWCADGIEPQIENLKEIPIDAKLPWFSEIIRKGETLHVPDVAALPDQAYREREHFEAQDIQSVLVVPLASAGKLKGFLGFDAVRSRRTWSEDDRNLLRFLGETVGHVIERRRAEEALRESEARWQFALEGSGDGIWDWNAVTNHVYFSPRWKQMLGYNDDDIGDTLDEWGSRLHPDDRAAVYAEIERHWQGETPVYQSRHRIRCKDGSYKWILDRGKIIEQTEEGKPLRVIGTHTDISEGKRLQAEHEQLISELKETLTKVKQLSGLLPICSFCKKIRDDKGYWKQIEAYIKDHSEAEFSHSICQECAKKHYPDFFGATD